jgi:hypothetical protein
VAHRAGRARLVEHLVERPVAAIEDLDRDVELELPVERAPHARRRAGVEQLDALVAIAARKRRKHPLGDAEERQLVDQRRGIDAGQRHVRRSSQPRALDVDHLGRSGHSVCRVGRHVGRCRGVRCRVPALRRRRLRKRRHLFTMDHV